MRSKMRCLPLSISMASPHAWGDAIEDDMFAAINLNGQPLETGVPCSEWPIHVEIYKRKPAAMAIANVHGDACVALSCLRRSIPAFHHKIAGFGGKDIPCAPY